MYFMNRYHHIIFFVFVALLATVGYAQDVVKQVVHFDGAAQNLFQADRFRPYESGFNLENGIYVCDNGSDGTARRGVVQAVTLNQTLPEPIVAELWSRAENVSGTPSGDYGIYIDLTYTDGTPLWGQTVAFPTGTRDWSQKTLTIFPQKPIRSVSMYAMFRNKSGKASFRDMKLSVLQTPDNAVLFDGVPVVPKKQATLQIRDVVANSDFVELRERDEPFGVFPIVKNDGQMTQVTLLNSNRKDRCLTLVYTVAVPPEGLTWSEHPRSSIAIEPNREYILTTSIPNIGSNGRLSMYPFAAVAGAQEGIGVGIDIKTPAVFRTGYHSGTGELYVAVDVALTKESPIARINFVRLAFDPKHAFRGALDAYYRQFPDYFASQTPEQGIWMPFSAISKVPNHEDFGFKFKEGHDETAWDDAHNILTFRYTEPGTWWMPIPQDLPQTYEVAIEQAKKLADRNDPRALALFKSGMHDAEEKLVCQLRNEPWNRGAVWSINDMPEIEEGSFALKWSPQIFDRYYGNTERGILDGEYVDSAEGYVTAPLDFRRENFAAARTPLVFAQDTRQPAIYKGLMQFEYVRKIAEDMHKNDKLMFANSTPHQLCWLVPWFDVLGTETNWNPGGRWSPESDSTMLYRRALCGAKPYCFLMNTDFTQFTYEMSERFMKRSLAYGMFPGFFSADASTKTYFSQPELYERDRPVFKKYVPLCKLVAEAGWQPITLATSSDEKVYVERFGEDYFTVFNDSQESKTTTLHFENSYTSFKDWVSGKTETVVNGVLTLTFSPEGVALLKPVE